MARHFTTEQLAEARSKMTPERIVEIWQRHDALLDEYRAKQNRCAELHERAESAPPGPFGNLRSKGAKRAAATRAAKVALRVWREYERLQEGIHALGLTRPEKSK